MQCSNAHMYYVTFSFSRIKSSSTTQHSRKIFIHEKTKGPINWSISGHIKYFNANIFFSFTWLSSQSSISYARIWKGFFEKKNPFFFWWLNAMCGVKYQAKDNICGWKYHDFWHRARMWADEFHIFSWFFFLFFVNFVTPIYDECRLPNATFICLLFKVLTVVLWVSMFCCRIRWFVAIIVCLIAHLSCSFLSSISAI